MAQIFHISCYNTPESEGAQIEQALRFLKNDGVIAMPSDTLYGLFAAFKPELVEKLHHIKKRNHDKPFLMVVPEMFPLDDFLDITGINDDQRNAMSNFWPGKNTLILPKNPGLSYPDGDTIALRIPRKNDNPFFYEVLNRFQKPLLAPSLNIHSRAPLLSLDSILDVFGESIDAVFFDENFKVDSASNLIDLTVRPFKVIRGNL